MQTTKKTCSPVERVSVVGDKDVGLHLQNVVKEPSQQIVLGEDGSHVIYHDVIESGALHMCIECVIYDIIITSSGSLKMVKGPSYSGLGVYSKSSTSAPITSRFVIR